MDFCHLEIEKNIEKLKKMEILLEHQVKDLCEKV